MLVIIFKVVIALGLFNVWLLRSNKPSAYRGGLSQNLQEEFAAYGLSQPMFYTVGFFKLGAAVALVASIWFPEIQNISAYVLIALLTGSVLMHVKIRDEFKKSLPAISLLIMLIYIVVS